MEQCKNTKIEPRIPNSTNKSNESQWLSRKHQIFQDQRRIKKVFQRKINLTSRMVEYRNVSLRSNPKRYKILNRSNQKLNWMQINKVPCQKTNYFHKNIKKKKKNFQIYSKQQFLKKLGFSEKKTLTLNLK